MEGILKKCPPEALKSLCQELHSIPPPREGSYNMTGVKLWLLTNPMRSWMELAWGLYRSSLDDALKEVKCEVTIQKGKQDR